jgi:integrase/recombinase XerD
VNLKDEINRYGQRIENLLKRIHTSTIDETSKTSIIEFYQDCVTQGYSQARIIKYLDTIERIGRMLGKPFQDINKQDVVEFVRGIQAADYSDWTKRDYKIILKLFYRWLKKAEDYPDEVAWIKARLPRRMALPDELLTAEDVRKIAEAAIHPRDKALALVLYESGCRIGELLSMRIKNVEFDEYGGCLIVDGKTGPRRVRIIASTPQLAVWLDCHPLREDREAPVWVSVGGKDRGHVLSYSGAKMMLKDIAKKAGIKKRVYPHLFRHSRATHLANHLTEAQMKEMFGWVQDSSMAATYVHLSGRDVDNALLALNGIGIKNNGQDENFKGIVCPRCKNRNSPTSKFCNVCGSGLDLKSTLELEETMEWEDKVMNDLVKMPEVQSYLKQMLRQTALLRR